jgi:two-component system sensor histidine kinase/response regulator
MKVKEWNKKNTKILIVDDVARNIQILGNLFEKEGFEIAYALNGNDALKHSESIVFDLVLLDIMMPEMDGFEVCEKLKQKPSYIDVPVIFITAKNDEASVMKAFKFGGVDYITKPFNENELLSRVNTHLELRFKKKQSETINQVLEIKIKERTKELQKAYKQLSVLEKAKNDFIKLVSHELRTPLNGIMGFYELLESKLTTTDQKKYHTIIKESLDRILKLTQVSELITSFKSKQYRLSYKSTTVAELVDLTKSRVRNSIDESKVAVSYNIDNLNNKIYCDANLITLCLEYAMENSVKFGHEKIVIEVSIQKEDNQFFSFQVKDNGPGFSKEVEHQIFELFSAGDMDHHSEGLGLSLSLMKLIVEAHQGYIEAKNLPKSGALVRFMLPVMF